MRELSDLERMLIQISAHAFDGLTFNHNPIMNEIRRLEKRLCRVGADKPPSNLVRDAVTRFYQSLVLPNLRDAYLVCFGCTDPLGQRRERLIEDAQRFPILLDRVDEYRPNSRAFRRCYSGLLWGYFGYDPDSAVSPIGKTNWQTLRNYLHDRIRDIRSDGIEPEWVSAIIAHRNLLTEDPCSRYGLSLLDGNSREFEEVKRQISISDTSWVITRVLVAQIEAAVLSDDEQFIKYIPRVLGLLTKHPTILNTGVSRLLERYRQCAKAPVHDLLRDFAVRHWGNPWLSSNDGPWQLVSEATRQMVADWLKLDLIRQFFSLLAQDGANDKRRLNFWERYHRHIDDMYFALGSHARTSLNPDFVELRKKMTGRLLELAAGGAPRNNAFIMCIGDYVAVEFGVSGNACYIFKRDRLPFDLGQLVVTGDRLGLKHKSCVERLPHVDTSAGPWERQFEQTIHQLTGVWPEHEGKDRLVGDKTQRRSSRGLELHPGPRAAEAAYSRAALARFCAERRLTIRDFTPKKGNLWVMTDDADESVNRQLSAWGFRYKPNKGWWRERP